MGLLFEEPSHPATPGAPRCINDDDDDVYYYIRWRLKLEGETENMGVCTKERKGVAAAVLMATPCTNSLGGESGGQSLSLGTTGLRTACVTGRSLTYGRVHHGGNFCLPSAVGTC